MPVLWMHVACADHHQHHQCGHLGDDNYRVDRRRGAHAGERQRGTGEDHEHRRQVEPGAAAAEVCVCIGGKGRLHQPRRKVQADVAQRRLRVARPAYRHHRGRQPPLEHQAPADDPGHQLPERHVGVRVGAAGERDHGGELGIAQARKEAGDARQDEGERDCRACGMGSDVTGEGEDAGADGAADTESRQADYTQRAPQA